MFTEKINAAIKAVQDAQELGVQAINESNLSLEEKDKAFAALGFDVPPGKPVCVLNRPPMSEELKKLLKEITDSDTDLDSDKSTQIHLIH